MEKAFLLKKLNSVDETFLKGIYVESEFIDPLAEIFEKVKWFRLTGQFFDPTKLMIVSIISLIVL